MPEHLAMYIYYNNDNVIGEPGPQGSRGQKGDYIAIRSYGIINIIVTIWL